jgi:protein-L-isoaspartate(D-aspartate) O-methyltransferase
MGTPEHNALDRLIAEIELEVAETRAYTGLDRLRPAVVHAMRNVMRHRFVPTELTREAYYNVPLPIGHGQTISQPYIVALMTDLSGAEADAIVLEVGTGSGYQAAVLAELVKKVYSLEIVPELARQAKVRLREAGYANVEVQEGNGAVGWPEHAPYDAIVVTAAAAAIPSSLAEQLKPGGRLMIPIGQPWGRQDLLLGVKGEDGTLKTRRILPVAFVPLTGDMRPSRDR